MYFEIAEQLEAARDAGELADDVAEVRDDQRDHQQERDAESEFLADQIAEPLPVTAPMRDDISCTTTSAIVIGIIVHSSE
jgi:hypothetical protein